jgi:uncharacterized protein YoxC
MVKHIAAACALTATSILTFACEDSVQDEMQDLREAREGTQAEVDELRQELQASKERVKQLEKDLAMAERGVTQDVLEERQELGEALKEERQEVRGELNEAQQEAQEHNKKIDASKGALEQTTPPEVEAQVESKAEVKEGESEIDTHEREESVRVKGIEGIETEETETPEETETTEGTEQQPPME